MKTPVRICFGRHDIKDIDLRMKAIPREGDNLVFPPGFVKYYNGAELEENIFKVLCVDFQINENLKERIELTVQTPPL